MSEDNVTKTDTDKKPGGGDAEKTYTKEQVESIVTDRLERDRKSRGGELEEAKKTAEEMTSKLTDATSKIETLEKTSATADEVKDAIKEAHAGLLEGIPEKKRSLIPTDLTEAQQVKYIAKNKTHLFGAGEPEVKRPSTPESDRHIPAGDASDIPGGYSSVTEFAKAEPVKYTAWRKTRGVDLN